MILKPYQTATRDTLRRFLEEARITGPAAAYNAITSEPDQAKRLGRYRGAYVPLAGLPNTPYVCLRLPTGGGKTILAAHAIGVARDAWVEKDFPLVLWLVPSNTIRLQTVEALRNPRHPYREAIDAQFEGRVRVFDITDFTNIRPHDLASNACVVVATIQTLRVSDTNGRKVYAHHEDMEPHFTSVLKSMPDLEQVAGGQGTGNPRFSFANLLHVHRPLMIVDEAHNAVTGLSREMQARVNPCAIIEFTATPRERSNILHSVTAHELREAQMIKLPIVLGEHTTWQSAVTSSIATRAELEKEAQGEADYIRPIVLFQAQSSNQEVTVEALKAHLIDQENIDADRIKIATGDQRELDGIDLFDRACKVDFIIPMQALKEGWDCSFAYVFCSVSRIQSATDVEQLLGRVLRMPYATRRKSEKLNRAYAHVSETNFSEAAKALADKLIDMGFDEADANEAILPTQAELDPTGLFGPRAKPMPVFRHRVDLSPALAEHIAALKDHNVAVAPTDDGKMEIIVTGQVAPEVEQAISLVIPVGLRKEFSEAVSAYQAETRAQMTPAERGETLEVPALMAEIQGSFELAEPELFMEDHDWSLTAYPALLSEAAFSIAETSSNFEITIDQGRVVYQNAGATAQLTLDVDEADWSPQALVRWLERQLRQDFIHPSDLFRWLSDCVGHLHGVRKIPVPTLMRTKFILARKLKDLIADAVAAEQKTAYQHSLFAPKAKVETKFVSAFVFRDGMYAEVRRQPPGRWRPTKHFFGAAGLPAFDGAEGGEELQCAAALDSLPQVRVWLRNVARNAQSFWLPTASGKFYPDFVAILEDNRILVVEYKGAHLAGAGIDDTNEKRAVGHLWEMASRGTGIFLMVEKNLGGRDMRSQMQDRIAR